MCAPADRRMRRSGRDRSGSAVSALRPVDTIAAPLFPRELPWVNVEARRRASSAGRPLLVEFWDFCRPNSMRTLPYLKAWHERYAEAGLRVVGVHCPGFEISREEERGPRGRRERSTSPTRC